MKGYKVFNPDWTCKGFRYEVGKTYELEGRLIPCSKGFHFCEKMIDCFKYYDFDPKNKVAEVEAIGNVVTDRDKSCTNKIKILRELSWDDVLKLVNVGSSNTGLGNIGDFNSGKFNSGNHNSRHRNTGNYNSGHRNIGSFNSGNYNSGNGNSGSFNSGHFNSGNFNIGDFNIGSFNSGNYNSGDYNSGNRNSGNYNSGNRNSGNYNSGNDNSGSWNMCDYSNGCFNTKNQKIYMFNKLSDWTYADFKNSMACSLLHKIKTVMWIPYESMTETEKHDYSNAKTTGGRLREIPIYDACKQWWKDLTDYEKSIIKALPNFDAEIFKQITGIDVDEDGENNED